MKTTSRMNRFWRRLGLRARLSLFIALAYLPLAGVLTTALTQERTARLSEARAALQRYAEQGVARQEEIVRQARSALMMLALFQEVREGEGQKCAAILRRAAALHPWSGGFSVAAANGRLLCNSMETAVTSIADQEFFQRAAAERNFVVSDFHMGRTSGKPRMVAVLPLLDDFGDVDAVLLAGVDLEWLSVLAAEVAQASGGAAFLIDSKGAVMARHPDPEKLIGRSFADLPLVRTILDNPSGVVEGNGLDGAPRIVGFASLAGTGLRFAVGAPVENLTGAVDRKIWINGGLIALASAVAVGGVWMLMEIMVLRGLRHLKRATSHFSASGFSGALGTEKRHDAYSAEIGEVAQAVHAMGQALGEAAYVDSLTGLPNRRFLAARIERLTADSASGDAAVAVLYMDLDGFKAINDLEGHHVGDAVLKEAGARLTACVRQGDVLARFGGDEFIALLLDLPKNDIRAAAAHVANRIVASLSAPIEAEGRTLSIGCSVGVAFWPDDHPDLTETTLRADQALYAAKRGGRGRTALYADIKHSDAETE